MYLPVTLNCAQEFVLVMHTRTYVRIRTTKNKKARWLLKTEKRKKEDERGPSISICSTTTTKTNQPRTVILFFAAFNNYLIKTCFVYLYSGFMKSRYMRSCQSLLKISKSYFRKQVQRMNQHHRYFRLYIRQFESKTQWSKAYRYCSNAQDYIWIICMD